MIVSGSLGLSIAKVFETVGEVELYSMAQIVL